MRSSGTLTSTDKHGVQRDHRVKKGAGSILLPGGPGGRLLDFSVVEDVDVFGDAEGEAGVRVGLVQAGDACQVPLEAPGEDLEAETRLGAALGANQIHTDLARGVSPSHLTHQVHPRVQRIGKRPAIEYDVVLVEPRIRRLQDRDSGVAKQVQLAEMLLGDKDGKDVGGIRADAAG